MEELAKQNFEVPSKTVMQRSRARLDVVCMLLRRNLHAGGLGHRLFPGITLNFDSGPQRGVEISCMKELAGSDNDLGLLLEERKPQPGIVLSRARDSV